MSKPEINVTPLIDVLLVLLIIFMVVTPAKPTKFDARVPSEPKPTDTRVEPDPRTLIVTVAADSSLGLNKEQLDATVTSPDALIARLKEVFAAREQNLENERTVFIKAPKNLDYGTVAKVVDALKLSGAAPISLQIDGLD
jgi:biopolymer transport protein ExbD